MESRLSARGLRILSNVVISFFALISLGFFIISIDKSLVVNVISVFLLGFSLYLMWKQDEFDSISLLIFFFGTTACFYFFSDIIENSWPRAISVTVFAGLSLLLSNYLLNTIKPVINPTKLLYKITLAIVFTEIFWVLSFYKTNPISKGAVTAVIFFNLQMIVRDILSKNVQREKIAFLIGTSIILLAIVFIRI